MPQVRMKTNAAGPDGSRLAGKVYNVDAKEAKDLLEGNYAEAVDSVEVADADPDAETADLQDQRKPNSNRRGRRGDKVEETE